MKGVMMMRRKKNSNDKTDDPGINHQLRSEPKSIDIYLPAKEMTLRVTFLRPPHLYGGKVQLQASGIDRRFKRHKTVYSPVIKDIIEAASQLN